MRVPRPRFVRAGVLVWDAEGTEKAAPSKTENGAPASCFGAWREAVGGYTATADTASAKL
jgi:hypothetical protein